MPIVKVGEPPTPTLVCINGHDRDDPKKTTMQRVTHDFALMEQPRLAMFAHGIKVNAYVCSVCDYVELYAKDDNTP